MKSESRICQLITIAKGELAAEALYYDGYFKNKDGKFEASNVAFKISQNYSAYRYFGAKGLVVKKKFLWFKDSFQATYI
jgi:hypothetical protein